MLYLPSFPFVRVGRLNYRDGEAALLRLNYGGHIEWVEPTTDNFPDVVRKMSEAVDILISR